MKYALKIAIVVAALQCAASAASAAFVYLAKGGTDTGACPSNAPCLTIAYAYGQATSGGGNAHITFTGNGNWQENVNLNVVGSKVEFRTSGDVRANINPTSGTAAVTINLGPSDLVTFHNITLGGQDGTGATNGILFNSGRLLELDEVEIREFSGGAVNFAPTNTAELIVADSLITANGTSGIASGISIKPASGIQANVTINQTRIENNFFGIIADGTGSGFIRGVVRDSVVSGNTHNGITFSTAGSGSAVLLVENSTVSGNDFGLVAGGAGAGMLVSGSSIAFNNTGLFTTGGGLLLSYKNNNVNGNATTDGAFTGPVGQQ